MRCTEFSEVYIKNIVYLYLYTLYHPKNGIYIYSKRYLYIESNKKICKLPYGFLKQVN